VTSVQQIRSGFLQFLKHYFNPLTRRIAHSAYGPFSIVQHVGRRSGNRYETPIIVAPTQDGFVFELTYGPEVDWYKNVVAAGGCTLLWHGKNYAISAIEPLETTAGRAAFPQPFRFLLHLIDKKHFFKMVIQP
jgi:deazaflavin-dependent oxidoreductase (nitroreductase family)